MDEDKTLETTADDDWSDVDLSDISAEDTEDQEQGEGEQGETESGGEAADSGEANQQTHDDAEQTDGTKPAEDVTPDDGNQTFTLNYLGAEKVVSKDEAVTLAQKGMDYDRIRQKHEETLSELTTAKDKLSFFEQMASSQGKTLDQLIDSALAEQLAAKEGIDPAVALGRVQLDRERKQLEAEKAKLAKGADEKATAEQKRQDDITAFQKEYPDVFAKLATDKDAIPATVWEDVNKGESLVVAYAKYERAQLKAELEKAKAEAEKTKQKQINKSRSTGSQTTKGNTSTEDLIDRLWNDN